MGLFLIVGPWGGAETRLTLHILDHCDRFG